MQKILTLVIFVFGVLAAGPDHAEASATEVTLYKIPQCDCCEEYAAYLRRNGFDVSVRTTTELPAMSRAAGIPDAYHGCHLSQIEGYAVSGHVPVSAITKLLNERPALKAISLPGMPQGSPGMTGVKSAPFTVSGFNDGSPEVYAVE